MKRLTYHNGRVGSARHNDRDFNLNKAKHIDQERTYENRYFHFYTDDNPKNPDNNLTFEEAELKYYKEHFQDSLDAKNGRYKHEGHKDKCQTMEQYLRNKRSCPEESLYYVGNKDDTVNGKELEELYEEYYKWHKDTYPNVEVLNVSIHLDEATPHIHERKVWITHDKDGNLVVGQNGALREMNISRPNEDKKEDRYNNPKITYTKMCREKLQALCLERGYELITEPTGKGGLKLEEFKRQEIIKENERIKQQATIESQRILETARLQAEQIRKKAKLDAEQLRKEMEKTYQEQLLSAQKQIKEKEEKIKDLDFQIDLRKEKMKDLDNDLDVRIIDKLDELDRLKEEMIRTYQDDVTDNVKKNVILSLERFFNIDNLNSKHAKEKLNAYIEYTTHLAMEKTYSCIDIENFKKNIDDLMREVEIDQKIKSLTPSVKQEKHHIRMR